ncbi:aspA, partial [Symbiodinium pilosum]
EAWVVADSLRADHGDEVEEKKVRTKTGMRSVAWIEGVEVFVEKRRLNYERNLMNVKAWAQLLAHLSGFAALEAGGALQHTEWFRETPFRAFLAVVINQVSIGALFRGMDMFRLATIYEPEDERVVMLNESIEEAENDIIGLSSSFLTVQVLRFALSGKLPDVAGQIKPYHSSGMLAIGWLLVCGVVALIVSLSLTCFPCSNRIVNWLTQKLQNILGMIFAWCTLWGLHMFVRETDFFHSVLGLGGWGSFTLPLGYWLASPYPRGT